MIPTGIPTQGMTKRKMSPITSSASPTPIMPGAYPRRSALNHDEALLRHLAYGPGGAFLRVARRLDSAVRHLIGAEGRGLVDDDAAELETVGSIESGVERAGEDARLEPEARAVRPVDRLVEAVEGIDDDHRPEGFLAADLRLVGDVCEHGRLEQAVLLASGAHFAAGLGDPFGEPGARVVVDDRADIGVVLGGIADLQRLDLRDEHVEERVEVRAVDVDPLHADAALAGEG